MAIARFIPFILFAFLCPISALAEYRLSRGDKVDVNVFRVPEMSREARLDIDGNLAMPPLGSISAVGLSLSELERLIRTRLADGQILQDASVTVALLEVRPIVVGGDVAEPGAVDFEAGMTVRQAIALAGGIGREREQARGETSRLRGEEMAIEAELLRAKARLARVDAEIAGAEDVDFGALETGSDVPERNAEVIALERNTVAANRSDVEAQNSYLGRTRDLVSDYVEELSEADARYQARLAEQEQEVVRQTKIQERGLSGRFRVSEETRRLADLIEAQANNAASIIDAKERRERLRYDADLADLTRRSELLTEYQDTLLSVDTLGARLDAVRNQMQQLGLVESDEVILKVFRRTDEDEKEITAEGGTRLLPGDFVEVDVATTAASGPGNRQTENE